MAASKAFKEEYEIVAYPKLHHVRSSIVQIVNRNTHIHQALELGLVLEGEATVHIGGKSFPIERGTLFFFNANEPHEITHDPDALRYFAIAWTRPSPEVEEEGTVRWTADQWEDYDRASPSEREYLIMRWGKPAPRR